MVFLRLYGRGYRNVVRLVSGRFNSKAGGNSFDDGFAYLSQSKFFVTEHKR